VAGNKPKMVLKDSSKYVKKKPASKQPSINVNLNLSSSGTPVGGSTPALNVGTALQVGGVTPPAGVLPIGNIMQSVHEGLSQILNPAQTFYTTSGNTVGNPNNTSSSGNSGAPDPHKQTPTFTQHMSKIIIKELDSNNAS
jgi:hypothetical protein